VIVQLAQPVKIADGDVKVQKIIVNVLARTLNYVVEQVGQSAETTRDKRVCALLSRLGRCNDLGVVEIVLLERVFVLTDGRPAKDELRIASAQAVGWGANLFR
jgi:hypothetical protein